ncbi:MAG: hypothetical protein PHI85_04445 [Victivallaceae bacterium]|nr:hypothetical protein [Victivallaceae bacterium]
MAHSFVIAAAVADGGFAVRHPLMARAAERAFDVPAPEWVGTLYFCLLGLLLATALLFLKKKLPAVWAGAVSVAAVRAAGMLGTLLLTGELFCSPADDPGYLETAAGILDWNFTGPWSFTIGQGFFYWPFMWIFGTRDYFVFAPAYSYFSALVISPLAVALVFLFLRRLTGKTGAAWAAGVVLAVYPFVFHWLPTGNGQTAVQWLSLPEAGWSLVNYAVFIAAGFNTMSDTTALLLIVLLLFLCASAPQRFRRLDAAAIGLLFGFACMVRLNNIFYAPALGLLWMLGRDGRFSGAARREYLIGISAVLLAFLPQLLINMIQHGGMFVFPYVEHHNLSSSGFLPGYLKMNTAFLFAANRWWWSAGIAALLLVKERKTRTVLSWWAIPTLLFFCGYPCTTFDAVRFILPIFGAFIGAICLMDWREWKSVLFWLVLTLAVAVSGAWAALGLSLAALLRAGWDAYFLLREKAGPA